MAQLPCPAAAAAANVAAGKEETTTWEDALDLDDSDICFVPPPLPYSFDAIASHPFHHQPHHRIPGPTAAVQDTILPRSAPRPPLSSGRGDADFLLPPWLCALQFLGEE
jgi:hypothetical protein